MQQPIVCVTVNTSNAVILEKIRLISKTILYQLAQIIIKTSNIYTL